MGETVSPFRAKPNRRAPQRKIPRRSRVRVQTVGLACRDKGTPGTEPTGKYSLDMHLYRTSPFIGLADKAGVIRERCDQLPRNHPGVTEFGERFRVHRHQPGWNLQTSFT